MLEKVAYGLLGFVAILYFVAIIIGMIAAFPFGLIGLVALVGFGLLFIKVVKERLENEEDDYYSKNIER